MTDIDTRVRVAAFAWLDAQSGIHGDALPRPLLEQGFTFEGERVPLLGPQGIFKPRVLPDMPLSITTSPSGPYSDHFRADGLLSYSYRGTDPRHRDNAGLRLAMTRRVPLVYLHGVVPGRYLAVWPVYVVGDDPASLAFKVAADDARLVMSAISGAGLAGLASDASAEVRRAYVTAVVRRRLHQEAFRERVIRAYRGQCALCRLRHDALLDAAHITPDSDPEGEPVVQNGLALCKLHHAAFDRFFLTVLSDYRIEVREEVLREKDGPVLVHALQEMHGNLIHLPQNLSLRPDPHRLEERYERFRAARLHGF